MASLLVTGGARFIGANFVQYWLARHPRDRVVVIEWPLVAPAPPLLSPRDANASGLGSAEVYP